jgi:hypothetical protein
LQLGIGVRADPTSEVLPLGKFIYPANSFLSESGAAIVPEPLPQNFHLAFRGCVQKHHLALDKPIVHKLFRVVRRNIRYEAGAFDDLFK